MTDDPRDPVTSYARAVLAGARPAAKRQRQACERHVRDLTRQRTVAFPYYFDIDEALARIAFFGHLRHSKGREWAGQPLTLSPFQCFKIGSIFGWKRASDDLRRFTSTYVQTPKKQGKSTEAAGVGIQLAFFDGEDGAEVPCAATKKDQARIVFGEALRMVRRSPHLAKRLKWLSNVIYNEASNSKMEPIGADEDTMDGFNPSGAIIDEWHAHKTRGVTDQIEESMGTRAQPLLFGITTPGFDKQSICYEKFSYACAVLDGSIEDETVFVFIADIDEDDDWQDPRAWAKANPGLGEVGLWLWRGMSVEDALAQLEHLRQSVMIEADGNARVADRIVAQRIGGSVKLRDLAVRAKRAAFAPAAQNTFKRFRLGLWTEQSVRAIDMAAWSACAGARPWKDIDGSFAGRSAFGGVDLASTQDIAGIGWLLETDVSDVYDVAVDLFIPKKRLAVRQEKARLEAFAAAGALTITEGNVIDYRVIRQRMRERREQLRTTREIGYDPWNATQFATECQDDDGFTMVEVRQGTYSMAEPTKKFLDGIVDGKLRHGNHPVLTWVAGHFVTAGDSKGNLTPDKKRASEKIDPLVMLVIALFCAIRAKPVKRKTSVYASRGAAVVTVDGARDLLPAKEPPQV